MLFQVVMRHGDHVRRIELDAPDQAAARMIAERQNLDIAAEHRTPAYDIESCVAVGPAPKRSLLARFLGR